ncbi:DUF6069 family protein [Luteipulveratus mongoliensis]|uniref:Cell envelope biogenesis protein OmpA n=1 Tax=Luteipulveratus mongoliensis TaxID=571913 RepID=A0A0K1JEF6_9MICO|nr:DUF6069 family protein [Luteipulveratus mongoliensis]AKU15084.1 hypothetical protein VV02_03090 [Luteipulveratus mongoliensis]
MSAFTATQTSTTTARSTSYRALVGTGVVAAVVAAVATTTVAAVGNAAGISLDMAGEAIPAAGFGTLTVIFSVIGVVLAAVLARFARSPRSTFVRTTVALTALSFVPDAIADAAPGTKALLMASHVVAAVIVIPAVARKLAD